MTYRPTVSMKQTHCRLYSKPNPQGAEVLLTVLKIEVHVIDSGGSGATADSGQRPTPAIDLKRKYARSAR